MTNVASISDPVKVTAGQALEFADSMAKRGLYNGTTARIFKTALQQFLDVLDASEPQSAQDVLNNLDGLCDRWMRREQAKPETAKEYKGRASRLLEDFISYMKDPTGFKGRGASTSGSTNKKKAAPAGSGKVKHAEAAPAADSPPPDPRGATGAGSRMRSYPLGADREIEYRLPPDGIAWNEVAKFALHLLTMARDFDPAVPEQARLFAIVKSGPTGS